jgi:hypothetical protein
MKSKITISITTSLVALLGGLFLAFPQDPSQPPPASAPTPSETERDETDKINSNQNQPTKPIKLLKASRIQMRAAKKNWKDQAKESKLGILGQGFSQETDEERKHLHLAIHQGSSIELRGYVQNPNLLENWIDPLEIIQQQH